MTDEDKDINQPTADKPASTEELAERQPTLTEAIKKQVADEDTPLSGAITFSKIVGGDILNTSTIRRQIWLLLLIAAFIIMYISNRYRCQQSLIRISQLKTELNDAKYRALSSNSMLTEKSRESHVLDMLKNCKDSTLHIATQPPYIINVPDDYEQ